MLNMEYLRNMVMGMRYQNGIEIDTDNMTYEELLQLQEKMGCVSKGLTEEQFMNITKTKAKGVEQVCSICYYNIKDEEDIMQLPCKHYFHVDCIKEWLQKERVCPMCKQQIFPREIKPIAQPTLVQQ